ncbi:chromosome segregation protein SMC [Clostridium butyricum]|uniref:chromosome segregation protein SMC n=1 Tax=Clostridium butyricum TaxID=1492 RepID=UPI002106257B|nr:chromosome segregation protein SMC [Clostridium butyricum]MCQ2014674.1 chromosome segregation protein SMC [Clostridium butyricum]MCQ2026559.1 chromosome segregation protein SMC [Clostridium butyricum]
MGNIYNQSDERLEMFKLNIYSPIFEKMLKQLDVELQHVLKNVYEEKFEGGDIKLSISVEINKAENEVPKVDPKTGELVNEIIRYKRPKFEYKTNSTLKKRHEVKGEYEERKQIVYKDDEFIISGLDNPQLKLNLEEAK